MSLPTGEKIEKALLLFLLAALFACMLLWLPALQQGVAAAISICLQTLIPSLFPMLFVGNVLACSSLPVWLTLPFYPLLRTFGIRERQGATALLLGILGGFSAGSACAASLYRQGQLSGRSVQLLVCCTCSMSPAFITGALGTGMFGQMRIGVLLFCSVLLANMLCTFILRLVLPPAQETLAVHSTVPPTKLHFSACIFAAMRSMAAICGCVCIFYALVQCAANVIRNETALVAVAALLEVTGACARAALLSAPWCLYACCAALSLNGASAFLQLRALLPQEVSLWPVLAMRIVHLPCSLLLLRLLLRLFPCALQTMVPAYSAFITRRRMPYDVVAVFVILLAALLVFSESIPGLHSTKKQV